MNQRITELMLEAGKTIPGDKHIDADFCNKFAELIIQECIKQARSVGDLRGANDDMIYGADYAALKISKYFGVE